MFFLCDLFSKSAFRLWRCHPIFKIFSKIIKMIILENINFSLIKLTEYFTFYSTKFDQRCENYSDQILSFLSNLQLYDHPIMFLIYQIHWKSIVICWLSEPKSGVCVIFMDEIYFLRFNSFLKKFKFKNILMFQNLCCQKS